MGNLKFCKCSQCRRGLRTKAASSMVVKKVRLHRRTVKQLLKAGQEDIPTAISIPYTD